MSLIVDGVRSIRRKWFADKKLAHIKAIGVQSKTLIWDGFVFRVSWQDDIVSLRHIKAPMGVLVAASGASGITLCSAEYWLGPFTTKKMLQATKKFPEPTPTAIEEYDAALIRFADDTFWGDLTPKYAYGINGFCSPSLYPLKGEDVIVTFSAWTSEGPTLSEATVCLFDQSGGQSPVTKIYNTQSLGGYLAPSTIFTLTCNWGFLAIRSHWSNFGRRKFSSSDAYGALWSIRGRGDARRTWIESDSIDPYFPPEAEYLRSAVMIGLGSYAFVNTVDGKTKYIQANRVHDADSLAFFNDEYWEENLLTRKWKLYFIAISYSVIDKETIPLDESLIIQGAEEVSIINAEQFLPLLDLMSGHKILGDGGAGLVEYTINGVTYNPGGIPYDIEDATIEVEWELAAGMLHNIFAWPNHSDRVPHDNVMFHSATSVYAWTRRYGAVEIRSDGMFPADLTMPPAVENTEGVRPVISHAGNGLFFCSCDQVGDQVLAVYRGTPFEEDGWEEIPLVTVGWANGEDEETGTSDDGKIMHVRPALVTEDRIVLLAITRDMLGVDPETGDPRPRYCFAYADGAVDGEEGEANTMLKFLAEIPITDEPGLRFDVITYGNGEYTSLLKAYPTIPPAAPPHALFTNYQDYPVVGS
jgi:hypothetical protein